MPIDVHRHYGASSLADLAFHLIDVHAPGPRIRVDQNRHAATPRNSKGAGDDSKGRHDHLIPRVQWRRRPTITALQSFVVGADSGSCQVPNCTTSSSRAPKKWSISFLKKNRMTWLSTNRSFT